MEQVKNVYSWLAQRLQEPSSWIGLCSVLTMLGVYMEPSMKEQFITFGVALGSFLAFFLKEKSKE